MSSFTSFNLTHLCLWYKESHCENNENKRGTGNGNFWQGIVAERMGYAATLYLDAAIVAIALCLIPFLRDREERHDRSIAHPTDPVPAFG